MSEQIQVVVAIIDRPDGSILIAKRPDDKHQGGKWEFPGGKVEKNEQPLNALIRELQEELAIEVLTAKPLLTIQHDYSDCSVLLDVWKVSYFKGEPIGNEGQLIQWAKLYDLANYHFPKANKDIISALLNKS